MLCETIAEMAAMMMKKTIKFSNSITKTRSERSVCVDEQMERNS